MEKQKQQTNLTYVLLVLTTEAWNGIGQVQQTFFPPRPVIAYAKTHKVHVVGIIDVVYAASGHG